MVVGSEKEKKKKKKSMGRVVKSIKMPGYGARMIGRRFPAGSSDLFLGRNEKVG